VYLSRQTAWSEHGKEGLALPALDLPVSRTGVLLYYPPFFKVTSDPGAFRTESYEAPTSAAFNTASEAEKDGLRYKSDDSRAKYGRISDATAINGVTKSGSQTLVDNYRKETLGGKGARVLPISVSFPAFGPSIFLVSELTAENQSPHIELSYQHDKKDGGR